MAIEIFEVDPILCYLPIETLPIAGEPYDPLIRVPQALKEWRSALHGD